MPIHRDRNRFMRALRRPILKALVLASGLAGTARADVTIDSAVTGPVNGDGGTFTVTAAGSITGGGQGINLSSGNTITVLTNLGLIQGFNAIENYGTITVATNSALINATGDWGIYHGAGSIGTLTNTVSGTINGGFRGIGLLATSGTLVNAGAITSNNTGLLTQANVGAIENQAGGLIRGTNWGLYHGGGVTIGTLTNSGTVSAGDNGIGVIGTITTLSNLSGGRIAGTSDSGITMSGVVTSLSNAGSIAGGTGFNDAAVKLTSSGTIGTLTNTGIIGTPTGEYGIFTRDSSGIGSIVNSGTIQANYYALNEGGAQITSILNQAGGLIRAVSSVGVGGGPALALDNYGTIEGGDTGIRYNSSGAVGTITNRSGGVIRGLYAEAIYSERELGSITNEAGGLIDGAYDAIRLTTNISSISNAGTINALNSSGQGVRTDSPMVNFTNSGTIQAGRTAVNLDVVSGTFTNTATGLITGGRNGYETSDDGNVIINAGQIRGGQRGVWAGDIFVSLTNQAGGVISGTTVAGLNMSWHAGLVTNQAGGTIESGSAAGVLINPFSSGRTPGTLVNDGLIRGAAGGVRIESSGSLRTITNSGTIAYTGAGTGPAVFVGTSGVLGVASGTAGPAIVSTGSGALLAGTIENQGTIHHGFTVANQNVTVSAGGGAGTFTNGTLTVTNGDLTFTNGQTTLGADISVNGGAGTVFNEGTLRLLGIENVTGNFQQSAGGTTLMGLLGTGSGQYGRLDMTGSALFAGTLALDDTGLTGGLAAGQIFQLFEFGTYSGGFSDLKVNGTSLTSVTGGVWDYGDLRLYERWAGTTMSLEVAAIPEIDPAGMGSVLALVTGSLGLLERRRRSRG